MLLRRDGFISSAMEMAGWGRIRRRRRAFEAAVVVEVLLMASTTVKK